MALEASGATVVPVGVGQSRRLLELIPALGITAIFGTLSFPAHLAARAREAGLDPRALGLRHSSPRASRAPASARCAREIEDAWGASVADTFGMSDVWSTMAGECGQGEGLHLTTGGNAILELVDPASGAADRARGRRLRRARLDPPAPRGLAAAALPLGRPRDRVDAPCACGRDDAADPHRGRTRRHAARAARSTSTPARSAPCSTASPASAATRSSPTATRSRRRCASTSRPPRAPIRRGRDGAAPPAARALPGRRARAGDAAGRASTRPAPCTGPPAATRCRPGSTTTDRQGA